MKKLYTSAFVVGLLGILANIVSAFYAYVVVAIILSLTIHNGATFLFIIVYGLYISGIIVGIVALVNSLKHKKSAFILFITSTILSLIVPIFLLINNKSFSGGVLLFLIPTLLYLISFILSLSGHKKASLNHQETPDTNASNYQK